MTRQELFSQRGEVLETHFGINPIENLESTDESAEYGVMIHGIEETIQNFNRRGSNWRFQRVLSLDVHFTDYLPLRGSSFIELPKAIKDKNAVINMKNDDRQCFKWCVTRALNPVDKNAERITRLLREQSQTLRWGGMKFPVKLRDIDKFERLNPRIAINVFGYEEKKIYPLRISGLERENTVNLLLIHDGERSHYCLISDMHEQIAQESSDEARGISCFLSQMSEPFSK